MVQKGESEFWVVSCISSGGRPNANISLVGAPQRDDKTDSGAQTRSYFLPAAAYEGQNVTCLFGHPKFIGPVSKVTTLPSFCEYRDYFLLIRMRWEIKQVNSVFYRCVWSPVVQLRFGQQQLTIVGPWVGRAAGRTE